MGLSGLLKPRRTAQSGRTLYEGAVGQSRSPALYRPPAEGGLGAPDTVEGRFELYTLHVVLILHRLKQQGPRAAEVAQALFDAYLQGLDDALRELGVGDLSVGKKMRKLGEAFYGRAKSYDAALAAMPDDAELKAVIGRTVLAGGGQGGAALADYARTAAAFLESQPLDDLIEGRALWPQATA